MREIEFRGWSINRGWLYGSYVKLKIPLYKNEHFIRIYKGAQYNVDPKTVGQYIGLKDKFNEKIFKDDILITSNHNPKCDIWSKNDFGPTLIKWDNKNSCWKGSKWFLGIGDSVYSKEFVEVVGNKHFNPVLLKKA